jgi:hypothetical protein
MQLRLEMPHFKAHCRDGSSYALHLIGLANFKYAWNTGSAFWTGTNAWGEETQIKLADITGLTTFTEESLALRAEEDEEEKRRAITA